MADYRDLLRRAIQALPENNGAARRQVYEKARNALVAQLRAINPPLPSREVTQHRLQLEDCIREVEQEATEQLLGGWSRDEPVEEAAVPVVDTPEPEAAAGEAGVAPVEAESLPDPAEQEAAVAEAELAAQVAERRAEEETGAGPEAAPGPDVETDAEGEPESEPEAGEIAGESGEPEPEEEAAEDAESSAAEAEQEAEEADEPDPIADVIAAAEAETLSTDEPAAEAEREEAADAADADDVPAEEAPAQEIVEPESEEPVAEESAEPEAGEEPEVEEVPEPADDVSEAETEPALGDAPTVSEPVILPEEPAPVTEEPVPEVEETPEPETPVAVQNDLSPEPVHETPLRAGFGFGKQPESGLKAEPNFIEEQGVERTDTSTAAMSAVREVEVDGDDTNSPDPQYAIDHAIAMLDREASGEGGEPDADAADGADKPRGESVSPAAAQLASGEGTSSSLDDEPGGNALTIFLVIFALLLAGAGGVGYWAWREGYVDFNTMFGAVQQDSAETDPVMEGAGTLNGDAASDTPEDAAPAPGNTTAEPDSDGTGGAGEGDTPRVVGEDSTADQTPPAEDAQTTAPAETGAGTDVADAGTGDGAATAETGSGTDGTAEPDLEEDKIEDRLPAEDGAAGTAPAEGEQAAGDTPAADAASVPDAVAEDGAQSLLLEASDEGTTGAVPYSGSVEWSRGSDELGQPTIMASASIPARNLDVDLLIRKNADPTLPASHLMEIDFSVNENFVGGSVASLPGVLMKDEELVQGVPLVGASARIVGSSFLFALSASEQDIQTNTSLIRDRQWMDLAMTYASGKRAIITLEKDDAAQTMFDEVMDVWASDPAPSAE